MSAKSELYCNNLNTSTSPVDKKIIDKFKKIGDCVYSLMISDFQLGENLPSNITVTISNKDGVASTSGNSIEVSGKYIQENPNDIDLITHELFHVIQNGAGPNVPGWITEGMADWARDKYGQENISALWCLPSEPAQEYDAGYRSAARFIKWVESTKPGFIKELFIACFRKRDYYPGNSWWNVFFGESIDSIFERYKKANAGETWQMPYCK